MNAPCAVIRNCPKHWSAGGFYPDRLGSHAMKSLLAGQEDYHHLLRRLKVALDPDNILAPGRYVV